MPHDEATYTAAGALRVVFLDCIFLRSDHLFSAVSATSDVSGFAVDPRARLHELDTAVVHSMPKQEEVSRNNYERLLRSVVLRTHRGPQHIEKRRSIQK